MTDLPAIGYTRQYHALRAQIDKMVRQGWSISGRDPVRLECCGRVMQVRGGVLING